MSKSTPRLGVDIGRVIIGTAELGGDSDTSFLSGGNDAAMETPAAPGSIESLARLVEVFNGQVWLVSKCGDRIRNRTRKWLAHNRFFEQTGINPEHLRFCYKRHEKRGHAEELGLGFFVDDRVGVLKHLVEVVPHLYLFGHQREGVAFKGATPVLDWDEAEARILRDLKWESA